MEESKNSRVTLLGAEIAQLLRKADESVVGSNALELEDDFQQLYQGETSNEHGVALTPPFDPKKLAYLATHNNTLMQCIDAMVVNVDGTGHQITPRKGFEADDAEVLKDKERVEQFLKEVYPGKSFETVRREIRRDKETVGYGYCEVIRNLAGDVVFLRRVPAKTVRMMRLDDPIEVEKTLERDGAEASVTVTVRERAFVQLVGVKKVFFREYGTSRHIDRVTGEWEGESKEIPAPRRGNELIMFGVTEDSNTPYYVPRWVNQIPAVLGSRKAEEFNLDYFNAGGIPPVLVMIMNGMLSPEARAEFQKLFSGNPKNLNRGALVEVTGVGGSLEQEPKVSAQIERFSSEQQKDHMFSAYDEASFEKVRRAFRLAPIFLGKTSEYNFATAMTAYLVTEAQVFRPERDEFDNTMNMTVVRELSDKVKLKSNALTLSDAQLQLQALGMVLTHITPQELVDQIEQITDMAITLAEEGEPRATNPEPVVDEGEEDDEGEEVAKGDTRIGPEELLELATEWRSMILSPEDFDATSIQSASSRIKKMDKASRNTFDRMVSMSLMTKQEHDPEGTAALCGCAAEFLSHG